MPLKNGYSRDTVSANIALLRNEGRSPEQAEAIALNHARRDYFKRHPHGFLPRHLHLSNGRGLKKDWIEFERRRKAKPAHQANPCNCSDALIARVVSQLMNTYRHSGEEMATRQYNDLIVQYNMSNVDEKRVRDLFDKALNGDEWSHVEYERREKNPVPPSARVQLRDARKRYEDFTGHDADEIVTVDKPVMPDVLSVIGDIDGVLYTTVRDGVTEKYIHRFTKKCRPLFCISPDGTQIFMLGGSYDFTERGIIDRTGKS